MPTIHLNSGNLSEHNFTVSADGMPDLSNFEQSDAFKYTFKDDKGDIYLLRLISGELIWIKLNKPATPPTPKKSPSPRSKSPVAKAKPSTFQFKRRQGASDTNTEQVIVKRRRSPPPRATKRRVRSRSPSETVDNLFEESNIANGVYYVGGPNEELVIEAAQDIPRPIENEDDFNKDEQPPQPEEEDEVKVAVGNNDIFKQLLFGLLFGRPAAPKPTPTYLKSVYVPPPPQQQIAQVPESIPVTIGGPSPQPQPHPNTIQHADGNVMGAPLPYEEPPMRTAVSVAPVVPPVSPPVPPTIVAPPVPPTIVSPPVPPSPLPPVPPAPPMDQLEEEMEDENRAESLADVEQRLMRIYSPIVIACLAKYNSVFKNEIVNSNKVVIAKDINFVYPLVITGGTAINFHYPGTVRTTDIDIKLVVPSAHYQKKYYDNSNVSEDDFKANIDRHIVQMNKIANLTRMKLASELGKCLNAQLQTLEVPPGIEDPMIVVKVVGMFNDEPVLVSAEFFNADQMTVYGMINNAIIIRDPNKPNTMSSITEKKMIKIVLDYKYNGKSESIELIDLGMFAKEPSMHYNPMGKVWEPTGYRSSFGNLLYDFFLDPKIGLGPSIDSQPYVPNDYKGSKYFVIPFVQYALKDGLYRGKYIKFSNLHRIVQNNFVMTLIAYDMNKLDPSEENEGKIRKYHDRFNLILAKIVTDYPAISGLVADMQKNAEIAIKEYREHWMNKNFECRYLKTVDGSGQSFYFTVPFTSRLGCENYVDELNNSEFTRAMRQVFQDIRQLPWNSSEPRVPEPEISQAAKKLGSFDQDEPDLDELYRAEIDNNMRMMNTANTDAMDTQ